jgi:TatD DNase family protein
VFDTHCHLNSIEFPDDLVPIINSARENDVKYFLVPGFEIKSSQKANEIAEDFENVYSAVGFHPTKDIEKIGFEEIISELNSLLEQHQGISAIGEVGLDYYRFVSPSRIQKKLLEASLKLSIKYDKSVILHNRQAADDVLTVLRNMGAENFSGKLVFHCCEPNLDLLKFAEKHTYFIGVDGDITYDLTKQSFIQKVPLELLVVETDSPYLLPEPFRSAKPKPAYNEPKNIKYIVTKVAEIKKLPVEKIIQETTYNALGLFSVKSI